MKKIFTIAAVLLMTASVWAQAPEKMSYQDLKLQLLYLVKTSYPNSFNGEDIYS